MICRRKLILTGLSVVFALPLIGNAENSSLNTDLEVVKAVVEEVVDYQMLDGQVEAVNKSTVSSQTAGVITKLAYDVGDYAKKGALIARISSENQKSGLQQAQAAVSESRSGISSASAAVVQAGAAVREANANYTVARAEFNRVKGLYAKRILARTQFDQAEAAMRSTFARVEAAKANQNAASAKTNAARSSLSAAKAGLSKAGEQLAYTEVIAPYSGIVTERHVELGEVVSAGTSIMTGISLDQVRVVTNIPQRLILAVRENNSARLYIEGDSIGIPVKKLTIFPYADPVTNAFKVRASLETAPKGLFPGVYVKLGFNIGSEKRLVVPQSAIAYRSEVTGVYVINSEGAPRLRHVRVGNQTPEGTIRILAGLDEGETIAIDPVHAAVVLKTSQLKLREEASNE